MVEEVKMICSDEGVKMHRLQAFELARSRRWQPQTADGMAIPCKLRSYAEHFGCVVCQYEMQKKTFGDAGQEEARMNGKGDLSSDFVQNAAHSDACHSAPALVTSLQRAGILYTLWRETCGAMHCYTVQIEEEAEGLIGVMRCVACNAVMARRVLYRMANAEATPQSALDALAVAREAEMDALLLHTVDDTLLVLS